MKKDSTVVIYLHVLDFFFKLVVLGKEGTKFHIKFLRISKAEGATVHYKFHFIISPSILELRQG